MRDKAKKGFSLKPVQKIGIGLFVIALIIFAIVPALNQYKITDEAIEKIAPHFDEGNHREFMVTQLESIKGEEFSGKGQFISKVTELMTNANLQIDAYNEQLKIDKEAGLRADEWDKYKMDMGFFKYHSKEYKFWTLRYASFGVVKDKQMLIFLLVFVMGTIGAFMHILPQFSEGTAGIKHNGIYHSTATSRGIIGILAGIYFIGFYILLYFMPYLFTETVSLADPIMHLFSASDASQWFMYGVLYTIAVLVMGVRMFAKYRQNNYHLLRTASVMFFQLGFAFLLPEILRSLNVPAYDMKNIWPLDYTLFYDWRVDGYLTTNLGIAFFVFAILLFFVGVPFFTYMYGKRWYCSWVCGCGGLAETLGDPYRQLSDKSVKAWKGERYIIHSVLVFAVLMTAAVLYTTITKQSEIMGLSSYNVREWYGLLISSTFAGVVGTGFYPLLGNRVWCRFGCPLAAIFGIIQRFKSRFRITTNGDQCISCGNCSTYCEQGIDVRWYAQRGQNIVRASCVGCGVCSAVCPRGVLKLENGPDNNDVRLGIQAIHISSDEVRVLSGE